MTPSLSVAHAVLRALDIRPNDLIDPSPDANGLGGLLQHVEVDTIGGIARHLEHGLAGLDVLRGRRMAAGRDDMEEWIVGGKIWLGGGGGAYPLIQCDGRAELPAIVRARDAGWTMQFSRIARSWERCAECRKGWTLENCGEIEITDGQPEEVRHTRCLVSRRRAALEERLVHLMRDAGFEWWACELLPNGYDRSWRLALPWFGFDTAFGRVVVGWRKHVLSIDWSGTSFRGQVTADTVTHTDTLVHAWSYEKAEEYLRALWGALRSGERP